MYYNKNHYISSFFCCVVFMCRSAEKAENRENESVLDKKTGLKLLCHYLATELK